MARRSRIFSLLMLLVIMALLVAACGQDDKKEDKSKSEATPLPLTYTTLTVQEAFDQMAKSDNALLVDVRNADEWTTTGIPVGATLISLPEFEQRAPGELAKDKEIYIICNSGNRSRVAADILIKLGYPHVFNIDGGIQDWLAANLPTEPYSS